MVALMLAQYVVDQVGRNRNFATRLLLARKPALDQTSNDGAGTERTFHQGGLGKPRPKIVAEHVLIEQLSQRMLAMCDAPRHVSQTPDREGIFVGNEAKRPQPDTFEPTRKQHAERLMCKP